MAGTACGLPACNRRGPATGDGNKPAGTILAAPNNQWATYESPADGLSLDLPADWQPLHLRSEKVETELDNALKQNPQLAARRDWLKQEARAGLKFFALERVESPDGFPASVKVSRQPLPPGVTGRALVEQVVRDLKAAPAVAKPFEHGPAKLPAGECDRFRYERAMPHANGTPVPARVTQYLFIRGGDYVLLTLITPADRANRIARTFERIEQGFRLLK